MTTEEFNQKHAAICAPYDIAIEDNSDFMPTGANYYKKDIDDAKDEWSKFFLRITGVSFEDGKAIGDPEGYLELLQKELKTEFEF